MAISRSSRLPGASLGVGLCVLAASACVVNVGPSHFVQGSGTVKSESRDVHGFDRVLVDGTGTLVITQGSSEHLNISAEDNVLPRLRSDVFNGRLELGPQPNTAIHATQPIRYELALKQLKEVHLAGSGDIQAGTLDTDQLDLEVKGSGNANIERLTAKTLTISVAGSGTVTVAGQTAQQKITISGAGRYRAADLQSRQATIRVSGSGDCAVRASDSLDVSVTGSGNITYSGSPTVNQHITGSGSVTKSG